MHAESDPEAEAADSSSDITGWLRAWRGGDAVSGERLIAALYDELRAMARQRLRGERRQITLQTTALVHETYLRLVGNQRMSYHCLLYTSPSPRDRTRSRMPSSA